MALPVLPHAETTFSDRTVRRRRLRVALFISDASMLVTAALTAVFLRFGTFDAPVSFSGNDFSLNYPQLSLLTAGCWIVCLAIERLYDLDRLFWGGGEFSRVVKALSLGLVALILLTYVLKLPGVSRGWTLIAWALSILLVSVARLVMRQVLRELRRHGHLLRPLLIVGWNEEAANILKVLSADPGTGMVPVGVVCSNETRAQQEAVPCLGEIDGLADVIREHRIDALVLVSSAFNRATLSRVITSLRSLPVDVHVSSGLFEVLTNRMLIREVSGLPLITIKGLSLSQGKLLVKRTFDLSLALAALIVGMPVWLLIALLIKVDSRGPIFFRQPRLGKEGQAFGMYKFRSMVDDAEARLKQLLEDNEASGPLFKMRQDPRITRVGTWLRRFSLDEFPQLINVVRGEMSLVGPRPPLVEEAAAYTDQQWRRLDMLPGLTGLWQVSGRSDLTFEEMVRLDLLYIENWSVRLDLVVLARTIPAVLSSRGAY